MVNAFLVLAAEEAEKSETIFYVLGLVFAAWAIAIGVTGMRSESFANNRGAGTAIIGVSIALCAGTMAAVLYVSS